MGLLSWLKRVFSNDRGFLVRDGKELRWPRERVPVDIFVAPRAMGYLNMLTTVVREINNAVGSRVLAFPVEATGDTLTIFKDRALERRGQGMALVDLDHLEDDTHGSTAHFFDMQTGKLRSARVTLPVGCPPVFMRPVMLHELCHVLGLDHDPSPASIMHPKTRADGQVLFKADIERLRKAYGEPPRVFGVGP